MPRKFHILIVEDELIIAEMLREMLESLGYGVAGVASDYHSAVEFLKTDSSVNFAICDINLNAENTGIEFGKLLQEQYKCPFIYLTSYYDKKTLEEAAETQPSAYLIKPFTEADIDSTLTVIASRVQPKSREISFKDRHETFKLVVDQIQFIESDGNYITIYTQSDKLLIRNSLDGILTEVDSDSFRRVHRSYVVNLDYVKSFSSQHLQLPLQKIPLSRKYKTEILALLQQ